MKNPKEVSTLKAIAIFGIATAYFYLLLTTLLPFLKENFTLNASLYWFITGYIIFIPLFILAIILLRKEGVQSFKEILKALNIHRPTQREWLYAIVGVLLIFIFTGLIYYSSILLNDYFGIRLLETTPWFMDGMKPYIGIEKLYLLVWFPMFFFNIVGEEILWRGYIQNRMKGKYAWIICSFLWMVFHIPFGLDLIILALPALVIIPYIFMKHNNTLVSIIIHGIYNGPIFILISLGLIK
jgi:membrane protease YdiL (CAAX protease family)